MALDYDVVKNWSFADISVEISQKQAMLYALGLGLGADPLDRNELAFVYEQNLGVFPSMPVVLGSPGFWAQDPKTGIDWKKIVHFSQSLDITRPPKVGEILTSRSKVSNITDRGDGRGALIEVERKTLDAQGQQVNRSVSAMLCRGDGGFAQTPAPNAKSAPPPDRTPDFSVSHKTLPQQALIYRLSGDYNPLHADPNMAKSVGFDRPILHGLCSFGIATHAIVKSVLNYDTAGLGSVSCRFSKPFTPGNTLQTDIWAKDADLQFVSRCPETGDIILSGGTATIQKLS